MTVNNWPSSVAVVGAAGVIGSGVVERIATGGLAETVYAVDIRDNVVRAHLIDIGESQIVAGRTETTLVPGEPPSSEHVDIVFVAASAPEDPDGDRRGFLRANLELLQKLVPSIERLAGSEGIVILLSNPVDILAECLVELSTIKRERILGYSLNDSIRLRAALGRELDVDAGRIDGWVVGEHGAGQVPLMSRLTLDGAPLELTGDERERVVSDIAAWFSRWSELKPGRSSGWTTPRGVAKTIELMRDGILHPAVVSTDVFLGTPSFVGLPIRRVAGEFVVELGAVSDEEMAGLRRAAASVKNAAAEAIDALSEGR